MTIIPESIQSLTALRDWLEGPTSPKTTAGDEISQEALSTIRGMAQPCANTSELEAITPVGAMIGGSEQRFGQDFVMVRCRFAQEYQDPNMPDVVCKLTSLRCISDLPRNRKSGVSMSVVGQ
jgi:hypothetical protein